MDDEIGQTVYSYNAASDVTAIRNPHGRRLVYEYDAAHQLVKRQDPEGLVTNFTRNERGQVSLASSDGLACGYLFNDHGDVRRVEWSNGLHQAYDYSSQGEILARADQLIGRGLLEAENLTRDGLGRKTRASFSLPTALRTHTYAYDPLGQLTGSTRVFQPTSGGQPVTNRYSYDNNANRLVRNNQTSSYNAADRITSISGQQTPSYNGAGAVSTDQFGANFNYNWRDQLTSWNKPGTTAQYAHDGNNLRLQKQVNGAITSYLWDGSEVLKEYNGDGTTKASYFLGGTGRQAIKTNGQWYIYLKDTHGNVTGLVDASGNRVATYEYGDYGETLTEQGTVYNPYRWNSEQLDAESGLVYLRNRYYQPSTGRFMQRDPIGYAGGLNLYSYCSGDPVNKNDPSGLIEGELVPFAGRMWRITTSVGRAAAPFIEEEVAGASMGPYGIAAVGVYYVMRNLSGRPSAPLPPSRNRVTPPSGPITIPLPGPFPSSRPINRDNPLLNTGHIRDRHISGGRDVSSTSSMWVNRRGQPLTPEEVSSIIRGGWAARGNRPDFRKGDSELWTVTDPSSGREIEIWYHPKTYTIKTGYDLNGPPGSMYP